jgi:murein L,D-transpeptidase YcbB/YkuD
MIRWLTLGVVATALVATMPLRAEETGAASASPPPQPPPAETGAIPAAKSPAESPAVAADPTSEALRKRLAGREQGSTDEERAEHAALVSFYEGRRHAPLWLTSPEGLSAKAVTLVAEIKRAGEWGLDPHDFVLPAEPPRTGAPLTPEEIADADVALSLVVLKYGRYARGGRIIHPAGQLSSYLDRRPQLLKAKSILEGIAAAENPDAYLRSLHPQHPQFERLRQKYLALLSRRAPAKSKGPGADGVEANRLLANMEQWRWMPADMGELYIWNNIPEYTQRVVKGGAVLQTERIVAGELGKQTPIFTRPMRRITFRPT